MVVLIAIYSFIIMMFLCVSVLEYVEKADWKWSLKILAAGLIWPLSVPYVIYELARDRWYD